MDYPKPDALQSVTYIIIESYTDNILPVFYGIAILKVTHYRADNPMPIRCFIVDTKHETIISHVAGTQPGLL